MIFKIEVFRDICREVSRGPGILFKTLRSARGMGVAEVV